MSGIEALTDMFGPVIASNRDGEEYEYFEDFIKARAAAEVLNSSGPLNHLWTVVAADDEQALYIQEGSRFVNRMHMWLVTTRPHNFDGNIFLWHRYENSEEAD